YGRVKLGSEGVTKAKLRSAQCPPRLAALLALMQSQPPPRPAAIQLPLHEAVCALHRGIGLFDSACSALCWASPGPAMDPTVGANLLRPQKANVRRDRLGGADGVDAAAHEVDRLLPLVALHLDEAEASEEGHLVGAAAALREQGALDEPHLGLDRAAEGDVCELHLTTARMSSACSRKRRVSLSRSTGFALGRTMTRSPSPKSSSVSGPTFST